MIIAMCVCVCGLWSTWLSLKWFKWDVNLAMGKLVVFLRF